MPSTPPVPSRPKVSSKWPLVITWLITLPFALAIAMVAALWLWTGSGTSLATVLKQASPYLPAGQTLTTEGVEGSIRRGGKIGLLRWSSADMTVEARQLELAWQPLALLKGSLQLNTLRASQLTLESTAKSTEPPKPHEPLPNLSLPVRADVNFAVDNIRWVGPPALDIQKLVGRYQFDNRQHLLEVTNIQVAKGVYSAKASLQANAPLLLDLKLLGKLDTEIPGGPKALPVEATASVRGELGGAEGLLDVVAKLKPAAPAATLDGLAVDVSAQIKPWRAQPVVTANAVFRQLDLAAVWPQAPQTQLTGKVQVTPTGGGSEPAWQAQGNVANALPGQIDKSRVPVETADASVIFNQGNLLIQSLNMKLAGGSLQVKGQLAQTNTVRATSGWRGEALLKNINPHDIHGQMASALIDGQVVAKAVSGGVDFDGALVPSPMQIEGSQLAGLRLQSVQTKGRWAGQQLNLDTLLVKTQNASLQGQLEMQLDTLAARGEFKLNLPGADANVKGKVAAKDGAGNVALNVKNAAATANWLAALPGAPAALTTYLAQTQIDGNGSLTGQWTGGWESAQQIASSGSRGSSELNLQAKLKVPRLDLQGKDAPAEQALRLREIDADLSGRISALALALRGQAQMGTRQLQLQTRATAGRQANGAWLGQIQPTTLQAEDSLHPGRWTIASRAPFDVNWQPGADGSSLRVAAGEATLAGPVPGTTSIAWQPVVWQKLGQKATLNSQGQLRGVPMGWLELAGGSTLAASGVTGDLLFDADWDATLTDSLKLRASVVRRSGDIHVRTDVSSAASVVNAGVKEVRLSVSTEGDVLRAAFRWESERAGNAQVDLQTRLTNDANGLDWAADAPISGTLKAQMPQVGVWSMLAPPGWRVRGTVDANVALSGNRQAPQWAGTLDANDLALRSVVDGVEFGNGRLRTALKGQRLDITEFSLQGAGGGGKAAGGDLTATGFAAWQPDRDGKAGGLANIHLEMQAVASSLRVSGRADRRLAMSGKLQAVLDNATLTVGGDLKVDQAKFILPDELAPTLGDDVVILPRKKAVNGNPATASANTSAKTTAQATPVADKSTQAGVRVVPVVTIKLDLGPDFVVEGRGLATRLAGVLTLRSGGEVGPGLRLTGEVRTVRGTYRAYGQRLDIEEGILRFTGVYDNPALDILAIRPNLTQRVGVQISGTVLAPRVRLYSEPDLPEGDKLAWLVLGRSGANGGAESALLQQAAVSLLGGNGKGLSAGLAASLGLDELSFGAATGGTTGTEANGASGATITLGKRISRDFYVAYERSLAGTLGTFSIFYDLSKRFTLRATTGEQSAIDLIFTLQYD